CYRNLAARSFVISAFGFTLQRGGELVEGGLHVRQGTADERRQQAGELLAHAEFDEPVRAWREIEHAFADEEAERHPAAPDHPARRIEGGHGYGERTARTQFHMERDALVRRDTSVDLVDRGIPVGVARRVRQDRPDTLRR